ncbi:MAG: hypothetical protein RLZZ546_2480 [Bacteroidota bacterium]|jgi:type I restriction enzyme R subunit
MHLLERKELFDQMEIIDLKTNLVFDHLKNQYFGGGVSIYGTY